MLLLTLLMTGCSSFTHTPFIAPDVDIPDSWQSVTLNQQVKLDPWWKQFNNPELNGLIERVLTTNNDLALATLTLRTARLEAGLTTAEESFQISSSTDLERDISLDGGTSSNDLSTDLSISYELDLWGRVAAEMNTTKWASFASAEDRESTAQSLVATTASLYWQIGYLKESIALSQSSIDYAQQTLDIIEHQYKSGAVLKLDVYEAKRSLASQQVSHNKLQQELNEANNALAMLYNQAPVDMPVKIERLPDGPMPAIAAGIPSELLIRRPDVKSALYSLKSAYASKDATFAGYLPTLTLSSSLESSSEDLKNLLSNPIGTLGANLLLPFLQWNELELNNKISELEVETAIVSYRQTLYQAFQEVDNAISAREHYQYQGEKLQEFYEAASAAEKIYASQYKNGAVSIQDWLDAKETQREAEQSLLENRYNQFTTQATLYQALGGSDIAPLLSE
jgi:NodT family efflux transporter outer membrane factor (OMF) lipoprotein